MPPSPKKMSRKIFLFKRDLLFVYHALLSEFLLWAFLGFLALMTFDTIVPNLVSIKMVMTLYFLVLTAGTIVLVFLSRFLDISYERGFPLQKTFLAASYLWLGAVMVISLLRFPNWSLPLFIFGFAGVLFLFSRVFLTRKN